MVVKSNFLSVKIHTGSGAWYGSDMALLKDEWLYPLSQTEIAEVKKAVEHSKEKQENIVNVTRQDFPLPTLRKKLSSIHRAVLHGRGFAIIRNFPVLFFSREDTIRAFWGLGTYLGEGISQNSLGHVIGHVKKLEGDTTNSQTRIYRTNDLQPFHTDSCDVVALCCLMPELSGGLSSMVSALTIHNEMMRRHPELLEVLHQPFHIGRKGEVPEGKERSYQMPIFHEYEGYLSIMHDRNFIDDALLYDEVPPLREIQIEALDMLDTLAADGALRLDFRLETGDIQLAHNHQILHARTKYKDHDDPKKKRHMLRLWLSQPEGRPLPPVFAERYGNIEVGVRRGGIVVPGMVETIPMDAV